MNNMKKQALLVFVLVAAAAVADYAPTGIHWKGWLIESSEDLSDGKRHTSYPLTFLFDGDPRTAWVFSGIPQKREASEVEFAREYWHGNYAISLEPETPIRIDALCIMNGYNKSAHAFTTNDRVAAFEIWTGGRYDGARLVKRVALTDKMGWHRVKVPATRFGTLALVFTKRYAGKVHDLCISGLKLESKGKTVDMHMPNLVMASDGSECGCGSNASVMTRSGKKLDCDEQDEGAQGVFSPDGVHVAGISCEWNSSTSSNAHLWVYNVRTGKRVVWRKAPKSDDYEVVWSGNRRLVVKCAKPLTILLQKGRA